MKIDSYEFGKIVIDGKEYTKDLIFCDGLIITDWRRAEGHVLTQKDMQVLWDVIGDQKGACDVLVVGTGHDGLMELSDEEGNGMLDQVKYSVLQSDTVGAVAEFNEFAEKGSRVVGAFHLTC